MYNRELTPEDEAKWWVQSKVTKEIARLTDKYDNAGFNLNNDPDKMVTMSGVHKWTIIAPPEIEIRKRICEEMIFHYKKSITRSGYLNL